MQNDRTSSTFSLLAGLGIGAALMYFLDPERGTRRRHVAADKARSALRSGRQARDIAIDARNRARGIAAELQGRVRDDRVTDDRLVARVRSQLGHHVERARAIEVVADGGTVTLRGTALADELPELLASVKSVRGVERVDNQLDVSATAGDRPSLQA
jgi:osmotically-inducible protein OsmY